MALFPLSSRASCDRRIHKKCRSAAKSCYVSVRVQISYQLVVGAWRSSRTIRCSYGWTNYFYVFISVGEHQRRFLFCAASDEWDLTRQCDKAIKFLSFVFVSKIKSCWFSLRIFLRSFCCVLCVTSHFSRCLNEMSELRVQTPAVLGEDFYALFIHKNCLNFTVAGIHLTDFSLR